MPLDPSIILGVRPVQIPQQDPYEQVNKSMTLRALLGQGDLQAMQINKAKRDEATDERVRALFGANPNAKPEDVMAIDPTRGLAYRESLLKAEQARSTIARNNSQGAASEATTAASQYKLKQDKLTAMQQLGQGPLQAYDALVTKGMQPALAAAQVQPLWQQAGQQAASSGLFDVQKDASFLSTFTQPFNPEMVKAGLASTMTYSQQLADQRARETAAETKRANVVRETETGRNNLEQNRLGGINAGANVTRANAAVGQVAATREAAASNRQVGYANQIRDEQTAAIKPLDETQQKLTMAKQLLATSSPASDVQLQTMLADLFDKSRTTNLLFQANRNFGTLSGRAAGFFGRAFTGQYTDQQRKEISTMINDMEKNVVEPSRSRIGTHYNSLSRAVGVNTAMTRTPNFYQDQDDGWKIERQ